MNKPLLRTLPLACWSLRTPCLTPILHVTTKVLPNVPCGFVDNWCWLKKRCRSKFFLLIVFLCLFPVLWLVLLSVEPWLSVSISKVGWLAVLSVSELFFSATKDSDVTFLLSTTSFCSELRDQGLTRPKILILVPFRDAALKVVEVIMHLICPGEGVSKILFCLILHNIR